MPKWMPEALMIMGLIDEWATAYEVPREAIERQIPIAYAWALSNPKRAPKKQIMRFLHSWMKSAKKWGNLTTEPVDLHYHDNPLEPDMTIEEMREIARRNLRHGT